VDERVTGVIVFGSINMDVVTACERHPRIGETVLGKSVAFHPGGKGANQAIAAARCVGKSLLVGSVGADDFGHQMLAHLQANGVETSGVAIARDISTGIAVITVAAQGDNTIVVTPGANARAQAPAHLPDMTDRTVALAQLETPITEIARFFTMVGNAGGTTILNPSPYQSLPKSLVRNTSIIVLNAHEFAELTGRAGLDEPQELMAFLELADLPVRSCIITLGPAGFVLAERGGAAIHIDGHKVEALDTTGAGDCFAGWFAAELAAGQGLEEAGRRANAAAAISVTRAGAGSSMPTVFDVESLLRR
jgi:ribokinase